MITTKSTVKQKFVDSHTQKQEPTALSFNGQKNSAESARLDYTETHLPEKPIHLETKDRQPVLADLRYFFFLKFDSKELFCHMGGYDK